MSDAQIRELLQFGKHGESIKKVSLSFKLFPNCIVFLKVDLAFLGGPPGSVPAKPQEPQLSETQLGVSRILAKN